MIRLEGGEYPPDPLSILHVYYQTDALIIYIHTKVLFIAYDTISNTIIAFSMFQIRK